MPEAFEKLAKMLRLERRQGHRDKAVIGGFGAFALPWRDEALASCPDEDTRIRVEEIAQLLAGYPVLDLGRRETLVDELLVRLETPAALAPAPPEEHPDAEAGGAPAILTAAAEPPVAAVDAAPGPSAEPAPGARTAPEPAAAPRPASGLEAPVSSLPRVKTAYSAKLERMGIRTVGDLLHHYPHRYDDYSALKPINRLQYGEEATVVGVVWETSARDTRGGGNLVRSIISDTTGTIEAVWFNQPYLAREVRAGRRLVLSGKVGERLGRLTLQSPAWEPLEAELIHTGRLVPVYPLTQGVGARWLRKLIKQVVDYWAPRTPDPLPVAVRGRAGLPDLSWALRQIHFPDSQETADEARRRLTFDEFLLVQLGMLRRRGQWQSEETAPIETNQPLLDQFLGALPYVLTAAQRRSLDEILVDLSHPHPMSRLLQGDVGSGKTVVAAAAMMMVIGAGKQTALMAPTEILAEQHHRTLSDLLGASDWGLGRPVSVVRLTGSVARAERTAALRAIAAGSADVVVGTHALIQRHVTFHDLALVIVDEQHRFGVLQRASLRSKGSAPHTLVMSATPIPRSLALTVFGDLDTSVIDELPPGRQPIDTRWLLPSERERAYQYLRSQVAKGRQAFILYPLIEESDKIEVRAAVEEYERLRATIFPDLRMGLLHGRMRSSDKDKVMAALRDGEIDILVSTSVIEVGIDVPNASTMLIEGADRFGLAQLHQFRGRVGRGPYASACLLLSDAASPDEPQAKDTWERLKAIERTQDGFVLAEKDLELRGPGDFFGVRQSGLPTLRLASLSNVRTLEEAREQARFIFEDDPTSEPAGAPSAQPATGSVLEDGHRSELTLYGERE